MDKASLNIFHGYFVQQELNVNPTRAKAEWDDFKILMFFKCKYYEHHIDFEINTVKNPNSEEGKKEIDRLHKARRMSMSQLPWKNLNNNGTTKCLCVSMFFLYILLLFPISVLSPK